MGGPSRRAERLPMLVRPALPVRVLHPALRRPLGAPPPPSGPIWPLLVLLSVAAYALAAAELSGADGWPLLVLMAAPVAAIAYDAFSRRASVAVRFRKRSPRIVADRRPVLLRSVLVLNDPRPARLIRKLPRLAGRSGASCGALPPPRGGRGRIIGPSASNV